MILKIWKKIIWLLKRTVDEVIVHSAADVGNVNDLVLSQKWALHSPHVSDNEITSFEDVYSNVYTRSTQPLRPYVGSCSE